MQTIDVIRTMIDYNYAAHRRLWVSIMALDDAQFTAAVPYSHGSIRDQVIHLCSVDASWLRGLREDPDARGFRYDPASYPTRESARALFESTATEVIAYVATLDDGKLQVKGKGMPVAVWQVLLHIVNHGTDHRAQILRAVHDLGGPTFGQDLLYYFQGRLTPA